MSLTLSQASTIIEAALKTGRETGCAPLAVAVLDAGGHLKAFAREDGAGILRPQIATGKAWGALGEIPVAPHVDDLVQRPDLGVPERGQLRVLLAVLVGLAVALLDLGQTPRCDAVRADRCRSPSRAARP